MKAASLGPALWRSPRLRCDKYHSQLRMLPALRLADELERIGARDGATVSSARWLGAQHRAKSVDAGPEVCSREVSGRIARHSDIGRQMQL
jgi:hypothetical protein